MRIFFFFRDTKLFWKHCWGTKFVGEIFLINSNSVGNIFWRIQICWEQSSWEKKVLGNMVLGKLSYNFGVVFVFNIKILNLCYYCLNNSTVKNCNTFSFLKSKYSTNITLTNICMRSLPMCTFQLLCLDQSNLFTV